MRGKQSPPMRVGFYDGSEMVTPAGAKATSQRANGYQGSLRGGGGGGLRSGFGPLPCSHHHHGRGDVLGWFVQVLSPQLCAMSVSFAG